MTGIKFTPSLLSAHTKGQKYGPSVNEALGTIMLFIAAPGSSDLVPWIRSGRKGPVVAQVRYVDKFVANDGFGEPHDAYHLDVVLDDGRVFPAFCLVHADGSTNCVVPDGSRVPFIPDYAAEFRTLCGV
jgi:hypothetical protein